MTSDTKPLTREQVESLEALRIQAKMGHSLAADQAYINGLEFHLAALRAEVEALKRNKQIADALLLEGSQKIDEQRAQLAQVERQLKDRNESDDRTDSTLP